MGALRYRLGLVLLSLFGAVGSGQPVPPPQTAAQRELVDAWAAKAAAASDHSTAELLELMGRPSMRRQLPPPLRQVPATVLLARVEAQLAVTEIIHQFKPARPPTFAGPWCAACAEGSESDGNPPDSSLSADFVRNLWEMGMLNETVRSDIEGWCTGTSAAERYLYGFPAFTARAENNATVGWPATFSEATARPVYSILNLEKLDAGPQQFGPIAVVFAPAFARDAAVLSPCDTGGWEDSCGMLPTHAIHSHSLIPRDVADKS